MRNLFFMLLGLLLAACDEPRLPSPFHAKEAGAKFAQSDFQLTDHNGKPRTLADFRGKVVVLFFGYTHCPDVCPTTLADMTQVMRMLDKDAGRVQVLFATVDPERDKPELLAQYVPAFHPSFLGLYGDAQANPLQAPLRHLTPRPTNEGKSAATTLAAPSTCAARRHRSPD